MSIDVFLLQNYDSGMQWNKMVNDLTESGMSYRAIGKAINTGPGNVHAIGAGLREDVMWTLGEKLRKLHAKVMRRKSKCYAQS